MAYTLPTVAYGSGKPKPAPPLVPLALVEARVSQVEAELRLILVEAQAVPRRTVADGSELSRRRSSRVENDELRRSHLDGTIGIAQSAPGRGALARSPCTASATDCRSTPTNGAIPPASLPVVKVKNCRFARRGCSAPCAESCGAQSSQSAACAPLPLPLSSLTDANEWAFPSMCAPVIRIDWQRSAGGDKGQHSVHQKHYVLSQSYAKAIQRRRTPIPGALSRR
jgi:hypothetical protein